MKRTLVKNAAILTVTSLILRTVGIFFRIYMSRAVGAGGMGLYQLIFSIYVLAATFASSGISTAVTRLVADELACGTKRSVLHVLRRSILVSVILGILSAGIVWASAEPIAAWWIKDVRAVPALKVLTVGLPFMGISSCLRGYFIAREKAATPSRAQLLEQVVRIAVTVILIERWAPLGIGMACTAVIVGDTVAEIASCLYLGIGLGLDKKTLPKRGTGAAPAQGGVLRRLWRVLRLPLR